MSLKADARGESFYEGGSSTVRTGKHVERKTATKGGASSAGGVYVLNDSQYKKFYECMTNPKGQTTAMKRAATLHRELQKKR